MAAAAFLLMPVAGLAEDWAALTGAEIGAALTARSLVYEDGSRQSFRADGSTTYTADAPSNGSWRVEGDSYCSLWPPSDRWACYGVERGGDGLDIRFIAGDGSASAGRYDDLQ